MADDSEPDRFQRFDQPMAGSVPVPDPTILTTQQLNQQIAALKELLFTRLDGVEKAIEVFYADLTRVPTDVDKQVGALHDLIFQRFELSNEKFRCVDEETALAKQALDEKIDILIAVREEQMRSIQTQFTERDTRVEQTFNSMKERADQASHSSKVAVDAALQAAKDAFAEQNRSSALAIAKSEAATEKAIDQLRILLQTATNALDGKITDIKDRITIIESKQVGATQQRETSQGSQTQWVALGGMLIGAVGVIVAVVVAMNSLTSTPPVAVERAIVQPGGIVTNQ